MAKAPFAILGGTAFPTQSALIDYLRALLKGSRLNSALPGGDDAILRDLLKRHPSCADKAGCGVASFEIREHLWRGKIKQRGFYVVRQDGSSIDFSFYMCLQADPQELRRKAAVEACRAAVAATVAARKSAHFNGRRVAPCEHSGSPTSWGDVHVDHAGEWPFRRIASEWLAQRPALPKTCNDDMQTVFADPADTADFLRFHDERAALRVIDKRINMAWRKV